MRRLAHIGAGLAVALTLLVGVSAAHAAAPKMTVKDGIVTTKVGKYTVHFPAKATTAAKIKAKAAQNTGGDMSVTPPPGAYFHNNQACGAIGTAVGYYWANQPSIFLSIYGVPWAAQVAYSWNFYRQGGIAWTGEAYRYSNTVVGCAEYVGDRANDVRDPWPGTRIDLQDWCFTHMVLGGWDDGGWNIYVTGWVVNVQRCQTPSLS